jgi:hypothetical protein
MTDPVTQRHLEPGFNAGRPWPASPAEYPLSGPLRGSVYMPPERPDDGPTPRWVKVFWAIVGCVVFYGVFCIVIMLSTSIASAVFG